MYIFEIDSPIEYPNQIPNDNVYNETLTKGKMLNESLLIKLSIYIN